MFSIYLYVCHIRDTAFSIIKIEDTTYRVGNVTCNFVKLSSNEMKRFLKLFAQAAPYIKTYKGDIPKSVTWKVKKSKTERSYVNTSKNTLYLNFSHPDTMIIHEIIHMWRGNLSFSYLNIIEEGLTSYLECLIASKLIPENNDEIYNDELILGHNLQYGYLHALTLDQYDPLANLRYLYAKKIFDKIQTEFPNFVQQLVTIAQQKMPRVYKKQDEIVDKRTAEIENEVKQWQSNQEQRAEALLKSFIDQNKIRTQTAAQNWLHQALEKIEHQTGRMRFQLAQHVRIELFDYSYRTVKKWFKEIYEPSLNIVNNNPLIKERKSGQEELVLYLIYRRNVKQKKYVNTLEIHALKRRIDTSEEGLRTNVELTLQTSSHPRKVIKIREFLPYGYKLIELDTDPRISEIFKNAQVKVEIKAKQFTADSIEFHQKTGNL